MAVTVIADTLGELRNLLRAETAITDLVGQRVYVPKLPRSEMQTEPKKVIVIRPTGGAGGGGAGGGQRGNIKVNTQRFDILCYGETDFEASRVARTVAGFFKYSERVGSSAFLHWVNWAGGFVKGVDPDTEWPFIWTSYTVLSGDEELA